MWFHAPLLLLLGLTWGTQGLRFKIHVLVTGTRSRPFITPLKATTGGGGRSKLPPRKLQGNSSVPDDRNKNREAPRRGRVVRPPEPENNSTCATSSDGDISALDTGGGAITILSQTTEVVVATLANTGVATALLTPLHRWSSSRKRVAEAVEAEAAAAAKRERQRQQRRALFDQQEEQQPRSNPWVALLRDIFPVPQPVKNTYNALVMVSAMPRQLAASGERAADNLSAAKENLEAMAETVAAAPDRVREAVLQAQETTRMAQEMAAEAPGRVREIVTATQELPGRFERALGQGAEAVVALGDAGRKASEAVETLPSRLPGLVETVADDALMVAVDVAELTAAVVDVAGTALWEVTKEIGGWAVDSILREALAPIHRYRVSARRIQDALDEEQMTRQPARPRLPSSVEEGKVDGPEAATTVVTFVATAETVPPLGGEIKVAGEGAAPDSSNGPPASVLAGLKKRFSSWRRKRSSIAVVVVADEDEVDSAKRKTVVDPTVTSSLSKTTVAQEARSGKAAAAAPAGSGITTGQSDPAVYTREEEGGGGAHPGASFTTASDTLELNPRESSVVLADASLSTSGEVRVVGGARGASTTAVGPARTDPNQAGGTDGNVEVRQENPPSSERAKPSRLSRTPLPTAVASPSSSAVGAAAEAAATATAVPSDLANLATERVASIGSHGESGSGWDVSPASPLRPREAPPEEDDGGSLAKHKQKLKEVAIAHERRAKAAVMEPTVSALKSPKARSEAKGDSVAPAAAATSVVEAGRKGSVGPAEFLKNWLQIAVPRKKTELQRREGAICWERQWYPVAVVSKLRQRRRWRRRGDDGKSGRFEMLGREYELMWPNPRGRPPAGHATHLENSAWGCRTIVDPVDLDQEQSKTSKVAAEVPVRESSGLLWAWPDTSPEGLAAAALTNAVPTPGLDSWSVGETPPGRWRRLLRRQPAARNDVEGSRGDGDGGGESAQERRGKHRFEVVVVVEREMACGYSDAVSGLLDASHGEAVRAVAAGGRGVWKTAETDILAAVSLASDTGSSSGVFRAVWDSLRGQGEVLFSSPTAVEWRCAAPPPTVNESVAALPVPSDDSSAATKAEEAVPAVVAPRRWLRRCVPGLGAAGGHQARRPRKGRRTGGAVRYVAVILPVGPERTKIFARLEVEPSGLLDGRFLWSRRRRRGLLAKAIDAAASTADKVEAAAGRAGDAKHGSESSGREAGSGRSSGGGKETRLLSSAVQEWLGGTANGGPF